MSLDTQDLSAITASIQAGPAQSMWAITIDPTNATLSTEYEQNIAPCDHLWLPTLYDAALGRNALQGVANTLTPPCMVPSNFVFTEQTMPVGCNVFDAWDGVTTTTLQNGAVYALRFNSVSNPWTLWGVGSGMSLFGDSFTLANGCGQASLMRAISGPIARMWWKLLIPALDSQNQIAPGVDPTNNTGYSYSRIVMMASLGYNQCTVEARNAISSTSTMAVQDATAIFGGGGYVTPQMSTAARKALADL